MDSISWRASGADFLHGFAALADQDAFLPFAFDVERGANADQRFFLFKIIYQHSDGVGDFFARGENRLLADQFGSEKTLGLVGKLVRRKIWRRFGHTREPCIHQIGAAFSGERGNRERFRRIQFSR